LDQATSDLLNLRKRNSGLTDYQKFESIVALMAAGGDCYDDMEVLRSDAGLQRLLGYSLPSPDSVRAFINAFHDEETPRSSIRIRIRTEVPCCRVQPHGHLGPATAPMALAEGRHH
jgi:hypothetical protein